MYKNGYYIQGNLVDSKSVITAFVCGVIFTQFVQSKKHQIGFGKQIGSDVKFIVSKIKEGFNNERTYEPDYSNIN